MAHLVARDDSDSVAYTSAGLTLIGKIWGNHLKRPLADIASLPFETAYTKVRQYFFGANWNEVYDFIEFVSQAHSDLTEEEAAEEYLEKQKYGGTVGDADEQFRKECNEILELEVSAYRFVGEKIAPVTTPEEIAEIEKAIETPLAGVKKHLETALKLFADRKNPDYRNSMKESISAVESICKVLSKKDNATLNVALALLKKEGIELHPTLEIAFDKLYAYTSADGGIRHAHGMSDRPNLGSEDAKFMLISCSAFVNYLVVKAEKAGIKL